MLPNSERSTLLSGQLQTDWHNTYQIAYRNTRGTCDALLCVAHTLQSALERGQEDRMVQIDFSAAFDRVNHQGNFFKLCSV